MARIIHIRGTVFALAILLCAGIARGEIHALLVGGGPDRQNNTAQIEEHLRFVASLVPASPGRVILFADGKANSRDLTYTDNAHLSAGQRALDILLPNDGLGAKMMTRPAVIGATLDGPARLGAIDRAFSRLAALSQQSGPPVLLYFAGHGSVAHDKNKDSVYNLWNDENLDPETLVREINTLPSHVPVTLVMAQCFSGGFGDVIFRNANLDLPLNNHPVAGFFAAESDREAAGCGTDTNSPLYQDFSSYFFGALSGRDKLGHVVTGADYDGDGRVSCHEAYCYAMIHDQSIDTPVCTTLVFLRKYADIPDSSIYVTPWKTVLDGADPAQKAALEALSEKLGLDGDQRLLDAYDRLMFRDPVAQSAELRNYRDAQDRLNEVRMQSLHNLFTRWPALRWRDSGDYDKATRGAEADLGKDTAKCQEIIDSSDSFDRADTALDVQESMLVRFTDLAEAIVRGQYLHHHAEGAIKAQFEALSRAENQPLEPLK
ncbi:MAG TPA: hypothetical protein VHY22_17610 [Chthoniobacteraceae bacterium]|jgi:hypothetical protein|nr:hypothetical protein [Chthoniobacteraceae bacterium]